VIAYGLSRTLPRLGNTPAYYAALVISMIPLLTVFIIFSDKVMANFTVGGLKG
jgi:ABC-type maltose transport system permease subunit